MVNQLITVALSNFDNFQILYIFHITQGGARHFVFPEKGKMAKIFFGKGRFQFHNRAIKTKNKGVFSMKEYFGSQKIKEDWQ